MDYLESYSDKELFDKFFASFGFKYDVNDLIFIFDDDEKLKMVIDILKGNFQLSMLDSYNLYVIKEFISKIRSSERFVHRTDDDEDLFYVTAKILLDRIDNIILERSNSGNYTKQI